MEFLIRQMLYPAPEIPVGSVSEPLEEWALLTSRGDSVVGWLSEVGDGPVVLYLHGNGENLETLRMSGLFEELRRMGATVLAIDFPGYGRSTGEPGEEALVASGLAAVDALAERYPQRPLFVVGWSLGAAVAVQTVVARRDHVAGLILLSPWHDLLTVASRHYPEFLVRSVLRDRYDSGAAAADLEIPVLIVHGAADDLIPATEGRRLAGRFPNAAKYVALERVGHNDLLVRPETWRLLAEALELPTPD